MRIAVSAGHGPLTPGKRSPDGFKEFQFTFPTAEYVVQYLNEYQNVSVLKVYEASRDIPLSERSNKANSWGADLYVSIHGNAYGATWNDANGIETLVYSTADWNKGYVVGRKVQDELIKATGLKNRGVKTRPDLWEMRKTNMPSFLCECGFYTNRTERELMATSAYQQKVARVIVNGIAVTYGLKRKAIVPAPSVPSTPSGGGLYRVQIGAFSIYKNAKDLETAAKQRGFSPFIKKDGALYKVQVGAFSNRANADRFLALVREKGFKTAFIDQ